MSLVGLLTRVLSDSHVPVRVHRESVVMGTRLVVDIRQPGREAALEAAEAALAEIERLDRVLTTWDLRSPMSRLNRAPVGLPVRPQPEIFDLLAEARAWSDRTAESFDARIGALVDAWGLRRGGAVPSPQAIARAGGASGPGAITLGLTSGTLIRHHPDAWIDTGCFGKGAALRSVARDLAARGVRSALLDLGGQLLAIGRDSSTDDAWTVGVAHPMRRRESVARLRVEDASVSTSGNSERAVRAHGGTIGHILDPRTGCPAPMWGSVTVVARDALAADVLSTALYVMGPQAGLEWSASLVDEGVLFLEERGGAVVASCNAAMERWLVEGPVLTPTYA
jgi:thiamine biosynthesis lipoprotein